MADLQPLPSLRVGAHVVPTRQATLHVELGRDPQLVRIAVAASERGGILVHPCGAGRTAALCSVDRLDFHLVEAGLYATPQERIQLVGEPQGQLALHPYRIVADRDNQDLSPAGREAFAKVKRLAKRLWLPGELPEEVGLLLDCMQRVDIFNAAEQLRIFRTRPTEQRLFYVLELLELRRPVRRRRRPSLPREVGPRVVVQGVRENRAAKLLARIRASGLSPADPEQVQKRVEELVAERQHDQLAALESIPWEPVQRPPVQMRSVGEALDRAHIGGEAVKAAIRRYIALVARGEALGRRSRAPRLLLAGPPGVGKTSFARAIADALGRPLVRLDLGGIADAYTLRGSHGIYMKSQPGEIANAFRRAGALDPVVLLDELDKLGSSATNGSPEAVLLPVIDGEPFNDNYLGVPLPVDRALWIATANDLSKLSDPLLDRFRVIELPAYTLEQRVRIAATSLLPRVLADMPVLEGEIHIPEESLWLLARDYANEAGVRRLRRLLEDLVAQALVERQWRSDLASLGFGEDASMPLVIDPPLVRNWLG